MAAREIAKLLRRSFPYLTPYKRAALCKPNPSIFVEGLLVENTAYKAKSYAWVFSCPVWNIDTHLTLAYGNRIKSGKFLEGSAEEIAQTIVDEIVGTEEEYRLKEGDEMSLSDFLDKHYHQFDLHQANQAYKLRDFAIANAAIGNLPLAHAALIKLRSLYRQLERLGPEVIELISCIENSGDAQAIVDRLVREGSRKFQQLRMK